MGKHTLSDRSDGIKFEAWARNAVAFIRSKGMESEFSDWCGGFPVPVAGTAPMLAEAPKTLEALDRCSAALQRLHTDIDALMADSEGVAGLHQNGELAPWSDLQQGGQFSDWLGEPLWAARNAWQDARAAIRRAQGEGSE